MRIIKLLVLSIFIFGHFSCSSDDDNANSFDIAGKWSITEGYVEPGSMVLDIGGMNVPIEYSGSFVDIDANNSLTFKEDKTFSSYTGDIALELTMTFMGTTQTDYFEMNDVFGEGTWEVNGRELKIHNANGTTVKYNIDNLNNDVLELSANVQDMAMEGETNPMLESMDMVVKMKLKRI